MARAKKKLSRGGDQDIEDEELLVLPYQIAHHARRQARHKQDTGRSRRYQELLNRPLLASSTSPLGPHQHAPSVDTILHSGATIHQQTYGSGTVVRHRAEQSSSPQPTYSGPILDPGAASFHEFNPLHNLFGVHTAHPSDYPPRQNTPGSVPIYAEGSSDSLLRDTEDIDLLQPNVASMRAQGDEWGDWGVGDLESEAAQVHPDFDLSPDFLAKLFTVYDTNSDGQLSYDQVKTAFKQTNAFPNFSDIQLSKLIQRMDTNKSGGINLTEFISAMNEYADMSFKEYDHEDFNYEIVIHDYSQNFVRRMTIGEGLGHDCSLASFLSQTEPSAASTTIAPTSTAGSAVGSTGGTNANGGSDGCASPLLSLHQNTSTRNLAAEAAAAMATPQAKVLGLGTNITDYAVGSILSASGCSIKAPSDVKVRWISFVGSSSAAIVKLGNAFGLHPLSIIDILEEKKRTKVEVLDEGNMHAIFWKLILRTQGKFPKGSSTAIRPSLEKLTRERISIFLKDNLVLTFEKHASLTRDELFHRIKYTGSRLRLYDAKYLVHALIDSDVDSIMPIARRLQKDLNHLYTGVHHRQLAFTHVKDIQWVHRQVLTLSNSLRHIFASSIKVREHLGFLDPMLRRHMNDVVENIEILKEHAKSMEKQAKSINNDFMNQQQYKMNAVMYWLTLVTSIFIPAQFLTGVYGMNFEHMPELKYRWAYGIFWAVVFVFALLNIALFHRYGWLRSPETF